VSREAVNRLAPSSENAPRRASFGGASGSPTIVWFRQDLRLQDNLALSAALRRGGAVVPVYIYDEKPDGR